MYSFLEDMLISKYLYTLLFIIESNYAYNTATIIKFNRKLNIHNRNIERKTDIIKTRGEYINNTTEYIFELCAIIDIMLPKK